MANIYIICPVRRATDEDRREMETYATLLQRHGHNVHLPHRDVDQTNNDGGVRICYTHVSAMRTCDEIHIWLLPGQKLSEGSFFDFGMAFMYAQEQYELRGRRIRFRIANGHIDRTAEKSFQNLLCQLVGES